MAFQVLDMRISVDRNNNTGTTVITTTPILVGDIGLITTAVAGTSLAGNVRVWLSGTVGVSPFMGPTGIPIQVTIERNGTGAPGTGTLIYTGSINPNASPTQEEFGVTAGDFPPVAAVNAGQIRYSLFVSMTSAGETFTNTGPNTFNGIAAAGAGPF
jgi:hypothetical protein